MTSVVWFRRDARLDDNPAVTMAAGQGPICALFVIDPHLYDRCSQRRRNLLVAGLDALDARIRELGGRLRVESGDPVDVVPTVAAEVGAGSVHVNAEVTPYGSERDRKLAEVCEMTGHEGIYAHPPGSVVTNEGEPYKVFGPFLTRWSHRSSRPSRSPTIPSSSARQGRACRRPDQARTGPGRARPGPGSGNSRRGRTPISTSATRIDLDANSNLSIDLKYGWVGPRRVIDEVGTGSSSRAGFVRQLAWRDFYGHLLAAHPSIAEAPLDERYREIEWRNDPGEITAWKRGETGFGLVDAAMRRLVTEGRMHNRARMIVASFLVKDLLVDWRVGERFFRHHLLDGDIAQNAGNWQWVAGIGTDSAPYSRVFNPVTQWKKFDPWGRHIRRWVPELADVFDDMIHAPWEAGPLGLLSCGVELGKDYPQPIVDHGTARERAIEAYERAGGSR